MNSITLVIVLNRWPETLHSALAVLAPFVERKVAVIDPSSGLAALDPRQLAEFDVVRESRSRSLDCLRNESLSLARDIAGDSWALVVDSDEFVEVQSLVRLREAIAAASDVSAFLMPQYNYVGYGRWTTAYGFRLFRLDRPIEYRHEIHESISASLVRHGLRWEYVDAAIQHLDFLQPVAGKRARYKALLAAAIDKGDDLAFLKTLYAMEHFWSGEEADAVKLLDEAILVAADRRRNLRFGGRDDFPVALKAQYLVHRGEFDQAATLFMHLLDNAETRVAAEAALGMAYIAGIKGHHSETLQWIDASLARWKSSEAVLSRALVLAELGESRLAWQDISHGLRLNPMAGDPRILAEPKPECLFGRQSLLHPNYRGLPALLDMVGQKMPAAEAGLS